MALPDRDHWTETEYLAFERDSDGKHESAAGQVVAMIGASWNHNLIYVNTSASLNAQLATADCRVTASDMRLKVTATGSYRCPDVMVICGEPVFATERTDTVTNPILVSEVLSESTALAAVCSKVLSG